MVDPKVSTISSNLRGSSMRASSQATVTSNSRLRDIKIEQGTILNKPIVDRSVSDDVEHGSAIQRNVSTISSKFRGSSIRVSPQTTIPSSSHVRDIKIEQTKILNKPTVARSVSDDVVCGSTIQRNARGTNVILNTNHHDPLLSNVSQHESRVQRKESGTPTNTTTNNHDSNVSNEFERKSAVRRKKKRPIIDPNRSDASISENNDDVALLENNGKVERRSAVRRHKKRPSTNDISIPENSDDISMPENNDDVSIPEKNDDVSMPENNNDVPENNDDIVHATDGVGGGGYFPTSGNARKRQRGACNSSKIAQMTRMNDRTIQVRLDVYHGRPTGHRISSLLSHAIGVQTRKDLPMHDGYWSKMDAIKKDEAIRSLMLHFDFEIDEKGKLEARISKYLDKQFAKTFREFKSELHEYFQDFTPQNAKSHHL